MTLTLKPPQRLKGGDGAAQPEAELHFLELKFGGGGGSGGSRNEGRMKGIYIYICIQREFL